MVSVSVRTLHAARRYECLRFEFGRDGYRDGSEILTRELAKMITLPADLAALGLIQLILPWAPAPALPSFQHHWRRDGSRSAYRLRSLYWQTLRTLEFYDVRGEICQSKHH